ncbi:alcohol dehydrogenase catalytic domain-containing protein [Micromonospora sp. M12]
MIATEAVGVAGVDVLIRSGALAAYGFREGHIPGSEVAGTVTAVGDGVDPGWVGQRVWAFTGTSGGYAERAVAPIGEVLPLPAGLSAVEAVTLGSSGSWLTSASLTRTSRRARRCWCGARPAASGSWRCSSRCEVVPAPSPSRPPRRSAAVDFVTSARPTYWTAPEQADRTIPPATTSSSTS